MKIRTTKDGKQIFSMQSYIQGRSGGYTILHHISEIVNKGDLLAMHDGNYVIGTIAERGLTHDKNGYTLTMVRIKRY